MPRVPELQSLLLPSPVSTSARCFQNGYLVRIYRTWSLFLIVSLYPRPSISLILDPLALPPLPRRPSPTQAPSAARMLSLAKLTMHRHVRIAFPFVHLVHITSRLLIALFPMTP